MAEAVKVAVRVRPFNAREQARKASLIIKMNGQVTEIKDPENPKEAPKKFAFDFSYWSHDSFKERSDGYLEPSSSKYADQKKVFDDLGRGVLDNAWKGYNTSLFAYGQTGSGKSYSMVGYGNNKGIVPISCDELFKGIEEKSKAGGDNEYQVTFSMLEIYNEQVRDLLNPDSLKVKGGLKVRQHPNKGFYVEQLKSVPVSNFKEIDSKTNEGTKNRTVASTNMNATSSRAHTIVAIHFTQKSSESGQSITRTSSINLVDLAGSERAESTGATGDRLKEGSAINQSLSTLGNVIKALADQSMGNKKVIVPFRDSVLTKLLKNALGGNSKTVMIAALSPADINFEETLSTLRFADRAKAIKTTAIVNESPTDKLIRELREENEKLKQLMLKGGVPADFEGSGSGGGASSEEQEAMRQDMEEALKRNQDEMEEMQKSWEEKLKAQEAEYKAKLAEDKKTEEDRKSVPHFWNLNEDQALSGMIIHFCKVGKQAVGSSKAEKTPDIRLNGLGILPQHAVIENSKNNKVILKPSPGARILLNGNEIRDKKELHHNDRLLFGSSNLFVFHHPQDLKTQEKKKKVVDIPTYESAQEEIAQSSGISKLAGNGKSKEDLLLQEDLVQIWPMLNEVNAMSEELDKKTNFEIALISPQARGRKGGRTEVCVKVHNMQAGTEFLWDRNKFINRKFLMQEMYQNYQEGDADWDLPKAQDPFWDDPNAEVLIGSVHVFLQSLAYQVDLEDDLTITDYKGLEQGMLRVEIYPLNKDGKPIGDDYVDDPAELVGKSFHFKIGVPHARGLPKQYVKSSCKFRFYLDEAQTVSNEASGMNPDYNYQKRIDIKTVTSQFKEYLENDHLVVEVYGRQKDDDSEGQLSTSELRIRDKATSKPGAPLEVSDHHYKMAAEANTFKRRMERAEAKLKKIQQLCDKAKKDKKDNVKVSELVGILHGGNRMRAVGRLIVQTEKFKSKDKARQDSMGKATSGACTLQ